LSKITIILIILIIAIIIGIVAYGIYMVADWDGDGIPNYLEAIYGTDPYKKDTDGDGISDYDEINIYKTDPLSKDTDRDGLSDFDEITIHETDPLKQDTDGDGLSDFEEIFMYGTNPLKYDTDDDNLSDYDEINIYKTDPFKKDTDNDNLPDGDEVHVYKTDPLSKDTDKDGLSDFEEIFMYGTNPLKSDTDDDGWPDSEDLCPCSNMVLNITIIKWIELEPKDSDNPGDPYIVFTIIYLYKGTTIRFNETVNLGLNVSNLINYSFIIDIPDCIPQKLIAIEIRVFDNDTLDNQPADYIYSIAYRGETPIYVYSFIYTLFETDIRSTRGADAVLELMFETICKPCLEKS